MTINTETIRDAAEVLDTLTSTLAVDHPLRTQAAARAKERVSQLYAAANEMGRLRAALLWTAGALQVCCHARHVIRESDQITCEKETRTIKQILDQADAALGDPS
ncbi:hypothetical protein ACTPOE_16900 [Castellaniella sp. WN]